jgi:protein-tyrosine phosphatase
MQYLAHGLWITDIDTVAEQPLPSGVTAIVSVCQDTCIANVSSDVTYEHVRLADDPTSAQRWGGASNYKKFENAADTVYETLQSDQTVVHCHAGRNRSVAVCAAVLARENKVGYDTMLGYVCNARRESGDVEPNPNELMQSYGHRYVWAHQ